MVSINFTDKQHFNRKIVRKCSRQFPPIKCIVKELRENHQRLKCKYQSIKSKVDCCVMNIMQIYHRLGYNYVHLLS